MKGFTFFLLLITLSLQAQKKDNCARFKEGKFEFRTHGHKENMIFYISRKNGEQIETDNLTTSYSKMTVKWTGPCTYETLLISSTYPFPDSIQQIRKTVPLKVEITDFGKDYYIFKAHRGNSPFLTDTIWVKQ